MLIRRPTDQHGHAGHDPNYRAFRSLRAIDEERVAAGEAYGGEHSHRDVEIITYVLEGELEHNDGLNNGSVIFPGDVHRMTAGRGITHSEANGSDTEPLHFLQISIAPSEPGLIPGYEQRNHLDFEKQGRLLLVASGDGRGESVTINQDVDLYLALLDPGDEVAHTLRPGRGAWLQVARGRVTLNGAELGAGDGAAVELEESLVIRGVEAAEIVLLDLG